MKMIMFATTVTMAFALSPAARATTISCTGQGKVLTLSYASTLSGRGQAQANFGDGATSAVLPGPIEIEVQISPIGAFWPDKEQRVYQGQYISQDLKLGFWISEAYSAEGVLVTSFKNIFAVNQKAVGTCMVKNAE